MKFHFIIKCTYAHPSEGECQRITLATPFVFVLFLVNQNLKIKLGTLCFPVWDLAKLEVLDFFLPLDIFNKSKSIPSRGIPNVPFFEATTFPDPIGKFQFSIK